jgi:Ni/Co efflux regulator RcnB
MMKKLILLAAIAAIAVPGAAQAQRHDQARHNQQVARQDRRTVRANRQVVRSDRNTVRANRRVARADRNVARASRNVRTAYVAPVRNWSYRPVSVGYRLQPSFYGSRYYINDYSMYHLQAPHSRWLRWIRYGNDLLLVNIRTGRVMNVVHYSGW